jgi:Ca2+-dependent lipid-binding protein
MKDVEGTSDAYVTCFFDPNKDKSTDTHWRCQNGTASFNWRMKFPYTVDPNNDTDNILTIQCYDRDVISSNDLIGQIQIPIDCMIDDALATHSPRYLNSKFYNEYWKE